MVFHISCSKHKDQIVPVPHEKRSKDISFFKNDTLKQVINRIIIKNNKPRNLSIEILDFDKIQLLNIKVVDSIDDCNNIKAYYNYNNTSLVFLNYSKIIDYDNIIDVKMSLPLNKCNELIVKDAEHVTDPKTYTYRIDKSGRLTYPNGENLIYKNDKVKIEWWNEDK